MPPSRATPMPRRRSDIAAYDLAGRAHGLPVHTLLGGAVRDAIPVTHSIGLMAIEEGEREAAKVAAEGIRTIKIKVGVDPARDVEMVRRDSRRGRAGRGAVRRRQRGLSDAGRGDQDHPPDGGVRPPLRRAAGARHRARRRSGARNRHAGDGGRKRLERPRRDRDHRAARRADRLHLHHQAGRSLSRHGGRGRRARRRHRVQRQRLGRARHRQSRQRGAGGGRAGGDALLRDPGLDAGRPRSAARSAACSTRTT